MAQQAIRRVSDLLVLRVCVIPSEGINHVKPLKGFTLPTIFLIAHFVRCAHVADSFARCAFGSASNINRAKPASGYCGRCGTSHRFHVLSLFLRRVMLLTGITKPRHYLAAAGDATPVSVAGQSLGPVHRSVATPARQRLTAPAANA